jgi:hypothetical protein
MKEYSDFAFNDADPEKMTAYDKYMYDNYYSIGTADDPYAGRKLNRKVQLIKDLNYIQMNIM